jgi:hypothetical protein
MGETILDGLATYLVEFIEEFRTVKLPPIGSVGPLALIKSTIASSSSC